MMIISLLIAFVIGALIFGAIYQKDAWGNALGVLVSFWLGVASCALIVFYSVWISGGYDPLNIINTTFIVLICCILLCYFRQGNPFLCVQGLKFSFLFVLVIFIGWILMNGLSHHNFYGDWDAWSFWNYRSRYLVSAGYHWKDIFTYDAQAKHPWLLSYWIVFGWSWLGEQSYAYTFLSAQFFGLMVLATVFISIWYLTTNEFIAFVATLWLASMPYFLLHSISQYADVITASLILLNLVLLFHLYQRKVKSDALLLGLMLGIMAFSKDEGILSALLIIVLLIPWLRKSKDFYAPCCWGLLLTIFPTIVVKCWMLPAPSGVNTINLSNIGDWHRALYIIQYFLFVLRKPFYGGALIIPFGILISFLFRKSDKQDVIMAWFLMIFIAVFLFLYLVVSGNLPWRLLATGERLVYQILPVMMVFLFYRLFGNFQK